MHTILRCTIVAHFTDKISVYFTHFLAKIPNSSRNFFFQLLPVLILRQSLFSFDQKSTLPLIFSFFMYLPPHRHYYSNLSIQPEKCIFSRINKSTIVQTKSSNPEFRKQKNTLPLTETRKRKGVELVILLSYQSQHVRISKANTSCHSARHLKHF